MAKTFTEDTQVHVSDRRRPTLSLKLYRRMRDLFSLTSSDTTTENAAEIETRRNLVTEIHHTADSLDQIEQTLLRKLGIGQATDRATDQLICQLRIETNRLIEQISELLED
jgi:hypothetical protein